MNSSHNTAVMATLALAILCAQARAQPIYRCGSVYQDRPCEGVQSGKVVAQGGTSPSPLQPARDAYCAQRGIDAQKIVWAREGGSLKEQLLAKTRNATERQLIEDVYLRRGSPPDVRASIEADCIAEKENAARIGVSPDTVGLRRQSVEAHAAPISPASDFRQEGISGTSERTANEAILKKVRCGDFKTELESIATRQRAGGSGETMDNLNQQRRDIERNVRRMGC